MNSFTNFSGRLPTLTFCLTALVCWGRFAAVEASPPDELTLTRCWGTSLGDKGALGVSSDLDHIFVTLGEGRLDAIALDGRKIWSSELGGTITSDPISTGNGVALVTSTTDAAPKSFLRNLSLQTGVPKWSTAVRMAENHYIHNYAGMLVVVSSTGFVDGVDGRDGRVIWSATLPGPVIGTPAFPERGPLVNTAGNLMAITLANGELRKSYGGTAGTRSFASGGSSITLGDDRGYVSRVGETRTAIWRFRTGGAVTTVLELPNQVLAASDDNFIYAIRTRNGRVLWKRRLSGRATYLRALGPNVVGISDSDEAGLSLLETGKGKIIAKLAFDAGELFREAAVLSGGDLVVLTSSAVYGYSFGRCKKE